MSSRHLAAAAVVVLLLAGCTGQPPVTPGPSDTPTVPPTDPPAATSTPSELVGMWRVSGAAGEEADTWLRIDSWEAALWRSCGPLYYSWAASGERALFHLDGYHGGCGYGELRPSAAWFDEVRSFRVDDEGVALLNADGVPVATLRDDGTVPPPHPHVADSQREPPLLLPDEAARLDAVAAPLPDGLRPAAAEEILGRWLPPDYDSPIHSEVVFSADGTWRAEACNGNGGAWLVGEGGLLLTTSGASTLRGCTVEFFDMPHYISSTRRVAIEGERLVLVGVDGERLAELIRG